jgi:hypothetical protein
LNQILAGEPTEVVIESIHDYLTQVAQDIKEGKIPLEDFIIYKVFCYSILERGVLSLLTTLLLPETWEKSRRLS